jgi:hypothetical protein
MCLPERGFHEASNPIGVRVEKEVAGEELNIRDMSGNRTLVWFGNGDEVKVQTRDEGVRFLLVAGRPIEETVAWHGPIVMNTRAELMQAMQVLNNGTFMAPTDLQKRQISLSKLWKLIVDEMRQENALGCVLNQNDAVGEEQITMRSPEISVGKPRGLVVLAEQPRRVATSEVGTKGASAGLRLKYLRSANSTSWAM